MDFMDMFAGGSGGAANTPAAPQFPPQTVWQGSGIAVTFHYEVLCFAEKISNNFQSQPGVGEDFN